MTVEEALKLLTPATACRLVVQLPGPKFWTSQQIAVSPAALHAKLELGVPDYLDAEVVNLDAMVDLNNYPYLAIFAMRKEKKTT